MPNHVVNEIIWTGITSGQRVELLAAILNADGEIDFGVLVPMPLNMWWGNVGLEHEKAFRKTALDWARENWGTKWNAYSQRPIEATADSLCLVFETAWSPPYPWLAALLNRFKLPFEHNWLDEGCSVGRCGRFDPDSGFGGGPAWFEKDAEGEMQRHLHKLQWGVEEFPADEAEADPLGSS